MAACCGAILACRVPILIRGRGTKLSCRATLRAALRVRRTVVGEEIWRKGAHETVALKPLLAIGEAAHSTEIAVVYLFGVRQGRRQQAREAIVAQVPA